MEYEIKLNDIANDLLILNKVTIDTLFKLEDCSECIALYMFYYKTAKWQRTNIIKANDMYVIKSLKWGKEKLYKIKNTLREHGLINIIQRRKDGKIEGWYIEVAYIVSQKSLEDIKIKVEKCNNSNNPQTSTVEKSNSPQNQQVVKSTSGFQDTNALKENNKYLNNNNLNACTDTEKQYEEFIKEYPKVIKTELVKKWFALNKPSETFFKFIMDKVKEFKKNECKGQEIRFIPDAYTWLNEKRFNAIYNQEETVEEVKTSKYSQTTPKNAKFENSREYTQEEYESFYDD